MWTRKAIPLIISLLIMAAAILSPLAAAVQADGPGSRGKANWEKISPDLKTLLKSGAGPDIPVIVQMKPTASSKRSSEGHMDRRGLKKFESSGDKHAKGLGLIGGAGGRLKADRIIALSSDPEVAHIWYDRLLVPTGGPYSGDMVDYTKAVNADAVWSKGIRGKGVTVAVLDSGVKSMSPGIEKNRLVASVDLVGDRNRQEDPGGHGTHMAGIIAGEGSSWSGIAPDAKIASVRVLDNTGHARLSTVISGIQWAIQNQKEYGIRIINLSLGGPPTGSYVQDPLAASVEMAWRAGLVVVAAAGNSGPGAGTISTPGYDPYLITVGALDLNATIDRNDDVVASFSSRGPTVDGLSKPDVVAPGRKIVSSRVQGSYLDKLMPDRVIQNVFFRLSGTSQSAAAVSGVAALILSANPGLTPDQIKWQLMSTATPVKGYDRNAAGSGAVDAARAIAAKPGAHKQSARPADSFALAAFQLIKGKSPLVWKDLNYNHGVDSRGTKWQNVTWDNVAWDNVTWDNVAWDNVAWDNVAWDNVAWDNVAWDNVAWDNVAWDNVAWDNVAWDNVAWDNVAWDNVAWDNVAWDNVAWDNVAWDTSRRID